MSNIWLVKTFVNEINAHSDAGNFSFPLLAQEAFDQREETFPRVLVRQVANRPRHTASADNELDKEITTTLGYQIEVYTRDAQGRDGIIYNRGDVGLILVDELQDWFWENYGLQRNTWSPSSSVDDSTLRSVFRVNGVIDKYGYIYRN